MLRRIASRIRLIRIHRTYTTASLAALLGANVQTVRSWMKKGLVPIDPGNTPLRFQGSVAKGFLKNFRNQARRKLGPDEFYCNRCKAPRLSIPDMIGLSAYRREIAPGKHFTIRTGKCSVCGCQLRRFATTNTPITPPLPMTPKDDESRLRDNSFTRLNINPKESLQ